MLEKRKIAILASSKSFLDSRCQLLKRLVAAGHEVFCVVPDALPQMPYHDHGTAFYSLKLEKSGLNPIADMQFLLSLKKLFSQLRPDMVLGYTIKPVIYGCIAARMAKVPEVNAVIAGLGYAFGAGSNHQKLAGLFAGQLYKIALKNCRQVIFQNPDDLNDFLSWGIVSEKQSSLVTGSGVDLDWFQFSEPSEKADFVLIARMLREKGILEFIEAAGRLKKDYAQASFKIVGPEEEGPSALSLEEIKNRAGQFQIEVFGKTPDVRPYLRDCGVFVLPSYYREGVPRIILEAMATGRAIITTDTPGCRETVKDGENGFLIEPRKVDGLYLAMKKFVDRPELIKKMGVCSRRMAEERFDVHRVNDLLMQHLGLL